MSIRRNLRRRAVGRLSVPLALAAAGGLGAGLGLLVAPGEGSASDWPELHQDALPAHLWPGVDTGKYTYTSPTCDFASRSDPINIVFHGSYGNHDWVDVHASAHGQWWVHSYLPFSKQYFWDHGECEEMDGSSATAGDLDPVERWHMRYNEGPAWDPTWGWYTVAAAHHEDYIAPPFCLDTPLGGHAVDGNDDEPPGGFNNGRGEIWWRWTVEATDGHVKTYQEDWDNEQHFKQCDGDYAWSNGMVYHISMGWPLPSGGGGGRGGSFGFGW